MPNYLQGGPFGTYTDQGMTVTPLDAIGYEWYINLMPMTTRFPEVHTGAPSFKFANDLPRPLSVALNNGAATGTGATFTVADASNFDVDDVIQIENEYMLVSSINTSTNVLTVTRGYASTTSVTHADLLPVYLITNTRTGAAKNIQAMRRPLVPFEQWMQTIQHAYSVGGSDATNEAFVSAQGTPLDRDRWTALTNTLIDFEKALMYGRKVAKTAETDRPQMAGFTQLLSTNNTVTPTNYSAYKPSDLIRDTFQRVANSGGKPTHLFVSTDFLGGFALWKTPQSRLMMGDTMYNVAIDAFQVSFLPGVQVVPDPQFKAGTALLIDANEVLIRMKRQLQDKPRGSQGDAYEGDIIMEGALEVDNESHHAVVQGITTFAAP